VARAFRSDAIVSLQFRPLVLTWTFTVIVRAVTKNRTIIAGEYRAALTAARTRDYIFPSPAHYRTVHLNRPAACKAS